MGLVCLVNPPSPEGLCHICRVVLSLSCACFVTGLSGSKQPRSLSDGPGVSGGCILRESVHASVGVSPCVNKEYPLCSSCITMAYLTGGE